MGYVFRRLVLWMLVCALPVQALAGTSLMLCGASHQRMQQAAPTQLVSPCHEAGPADAAGLGDAADTESLQKFSCSGCAQCCHAMALPMSLPLLAEPSTGRATGAALTVPALAYLTEGQDRPPRASRC